VALPIAHAPRLRLRYAGWHGDAERRIVIGVRLWNSDKMPLLFRLHENGKPIGDTVQIPLNGGDIYVMSSAAVGFEWRKKGKHFLHASGCDRYAPNPMDWYEKKQRAKASKKRKAGSVEASPRP
jgi:hypothetical protein